MQPKATKLHTALEGLWKLEVFSAITGKKTKQTGWFPNLILDSGLDRYGTATLAGGRCFVGTGSTAPAVSQTALVSKVGESGNGVVIDSGSSGSSPWYIFIKLRYTFAAGDAAGNLTEIGVGPSSTVDLFSRALIVDEFGDPTTLTVLSDEILRAEYELRMYSPTVDTSGSITLDGVLTAWAGRAYVVQTYASTGTAIGWTFARHAGNAGTVLGKTDSTLLDVDASPTGSALAGGVSADGYTLGSYKRSATWTWTITQGNALVDGIGWMRFYFGIGTWQVSFDPPIPKDGDKTLSLTMEHSWGRKT